ncbi:MAG: pyridoxamine 5'-phosphate oxidase family protein [Burkholderiales bacterium]
MTQRTRAGILHAGELDAQERYNPAGMWPDAAVDRMFKQAIDEETAFFIESLGFFFIATADSHGNCDCSFRGTEPGADGANQPAVIVADAKTLVYPDYRGNNLYNSIGNILQNPHIGMLFIDFPTAQRLRVNGTVEIVEEPGAYYPIWTSALRYMRVTVDQVFGNCSKRIPKIG